MQIGLGLWLGTRQVGGASGPFYPAAVLFAAGEQGGWYDPSDISTLFQDSVGNTPVTATGQTVGLVLDKSRGLVLGSELVTNGNFSQGGTGWTTGPGWSISGGSASIDGTNAASSLLRQSTVVTVVGRTYLVSYTYSVTAGNIRLNTGQFGTTTSFAAGTSGVYTAYLVAIGTTGSFDVQAQSANTIATVDNISVKEVPGNHLTQATAADRPAYGIEPFGGRRNLLTRTEEFDNATAWGNSVTGTGVAPTVTANDGTAPDGTPTADRLQFSLGGGTASGDITRRRQVITPPAGNNTFSVYLRSYDGVSTYNMHLVDAAGTTRNIVVTGAWQRFEVTATAPGTSATFAVGLRGAQTPANSNTADILALGAQDEASATATAYQRVTDEFNVTEEGVPSVSYLVFITNKWFVSPTITPGIDKAQVFAGVRKLSDAARGAVLGMSTVPNANSGIFELFAPGVDATADYRFISRGTSNSTAIASVVAPSTNVVTGLGDISGDTSTIRVNGSQIAQSATDQGTGNYLAYPLFVGRRGGTVLPFNGRLYQLLVRFGANLDAATITATETFVNSKTGAY